MHSALIIIEVPENEQRWLAFVATIDRLQSENPDPLHKARGVERLAPNVWLVAFRENPEPLARLVSAATEYRFSYEILQFDAEPQWIHGGPAKLKPPG